MLKLFKGNTSEVLEKELLKSTVDADKVQKLINNGIDINQRDEKGRTFLFSLASKRKIDAIKILLKNKIDINIEDDYGKTVLAEAVSKGDGMMIRFLLDNGASVNHKNSSNRTIIQDVALEGDYKVFRILMNYKPDFNLKDNYNKIDQLHRALSHDSLSGLAWYNLAILYNENSNFSQAAFCFTMAGISQTNDIEAWRNSTLCYFNSNENLTLLPLIIKTAYFFNGEDYLDSLYTHLENQDKSTKTNKIVEIIEEIITEENRKVHLPTVRFLNDKGQFKDIFKEIKKYD